VKPNNVKTQQYKNPTIIIQSWVVGWVERSETQQCRNPTM
jgi:hypothetical protein